MHNEVEHTFSVGDAVRTLPSVKPRRYADRPGFVVVINRIDGEYGVILTTTRPQWRKDRPNEIAYDSDAVSWFVPRELVPRTNA